jgi:hypothetical protein
MAQANDQMPVHQHPGVLLPLREVQDLPADPGALAELGLGDVVAGQAAEHWEQLRQLAPLVATTVTLLRTAQCSRPGDSASNRFISTTRLYVHTPSSADRYTGRVAHPDG